MNLGLGNWQSVDMQICSACMHLLIVLLMAHALYGIARVASSVCMYRLDHKGYFMPLFQGDYTPKMYWWSVTPTKIVKITLLAIMALIMSGGIINMLFYFPLVADYVWLSGKDDSFFRRPVVVGLHMLAMGVIFTFAVQQGLRGAVKQPSNRVF